VDDTLKEAFQVKKPVVIDFQVDPYENCYPMIPAGAGHHEMVFSDPEEAGQGTPAKEENTEGVLTA
jgi:acetolactate synthase-1/2/3 large subunit